MNSGIALQSDREQRKTKMNAIAWRHCSKCEKLIVLDYYPFNKTISKELDTLEEEHQLHLCSYCSKVFPTCNAKEIVFGSCVGNDNVLECDGYMSRMPSL